MGRKKAATVVKRVPGAIAGATSLAAPPATAPKQTMQVEEHKQDEADDDNDDEEEDDEDDGPPGPPDMLNLLINEYKDRNHGTEPDEQTLKQWTEVLSAGVEDAPGKSDEDDDDDDDDDGSLSHLGGTVNWGSLAAPENSSSAALGNKAAAVATTSTPFGSSTGFSFKAPAFSSTFGAAAPTSSSNSAPFFSFGALSSPAPTTSADKEFSSKGGSVFGGSGGFGGSSKTGLGFGAAPPSLRRFHFPRPPSLPRRRAPASRARRRLRS